MHVLASSPQIIFLVTFAAKDQVSRKWKSAPYWSIWGKECRARVSSHWWGGSVRDDPINGCEGDYY